MKDQSLKFYIFHCSASLDTDELFRAFSSPGSDTVKIIGLPCSGKADTLYLLKAFETGADGVVLITCPEGECRYLEGNIRAVRRAKAVDTLLEEIGYGAGRITVIRMHGDGMKDIVRELGAFIERVRKLPGPGVSYDMSLQPEKLVVKST